MEMESYIKWGGWASRFLTEFSVEQVETSVELVENSRK